MYRIPLKEPWKKSDFLQEIIQRGRTPLTSSIGTHDESHSIPCASLREASVRAVPKVVLNVFLNNVSLLMHFVYGLEC